jgi:hypothetical protein
MKNKQHKGKHTNFFVGAVGDSLIIYFPVETIPKQIGRA